MSYQIIDAVMARAIQADAARTHALRRAAANALTDNESWERDSLYALRLSIERGDQLEVNAARGTPLPSPCRAVVAVSGWRPGVGGAT
jgi:hypothetical protein